MRLLAFDLATAAGVAIGDVSAAPDCLTLDLSGRTHGAMFAAAFRATRDLLRDRSPDLIALEQAIASGAVGKQSRVQLAMGYRAAVMAVAHMAGVRVVEYPVASIRKHFIGTGGLRRAEAKHSTLARCHLLSWPAKNDNEADACAVWDYARAKAGRDATPVPGSFFDDGRPGGRAAAQRRG